MEMNGTQIGAATYAMKRAMEMPNILLDLVQSSAEKDQPTLAQQSPLPRAVGVSAVTGTGNRIDLVV